MCDSCGETFREEDHLARHKRVHHTAAGGNGNGSSSQDALNQNAVSTTTQVTDDPEQELKMDHNSDENVNALSIACFGMNTPGSNRSTPLRTLPDESRPASSEQPPHCLVTLDTPDVFIDRRICDEPYENNSALNLSTKPDISRQMSISSCYTPTDSNPMANHSSLTYIKTEPVNNGVGMYMTPSFSGEERNDDVGERIEENSSLSEERFAEGSPSLMQTAYAQTLRTTTTTTTATNGGTIASLLQQQHHPESIPPSFSLQRNPQLTSESYTQQFQGKRCHHCVSCGIWFEDLAMSMLHNSLHFTDGHNEFSCKKCSKKLSNRLEFTAHLVWHLEPNGQ